MKIEHKSEKGSALFYIEQEGEILAELSYELRGNDRMVIHHTHVSKKLAGKGIGKQLVDKAVDLAREKKIVIVPVCSFAAEVLKAESYKDVIG